MGYLKILIGIIFLSPIVTAGESISSIDRQASRQLNTRGYRLYKEKHYVEALALFLESTQKDPLYAQAHFNAACTAVLLLNECGDFDSPDPSGKTYAGPDPDIFGHIKRAIKIDPEFLKKVESDPDLNSVRHSLAYLVSIGHSLNDASQHAFFLKRVHKWAGAPSAGVGVIEVMEFEEDGTLTYSYREGEKFPEGASDGESRGINSRVINGRYEVNNGKIEVDLDIPINGRTQFKGTLTNEGRIQFNDNLGPLTPWESDCGV